MGPCWLLACPLPLRACAEGLCLGLVGGTGGGLLKALVSIGPLLSKEASGQSAL